MKKAVAWEIGVDGKPKPLAVGYVDLEKHLEDWADSDIDIITDDVLLIGRQVVTSYGTKLDLLGIDAQGDLVIIELKRDQTLRETAAQGIEYAAWAAKLGYSDVLQYGALRYGHEDGFRKVFKERFGIPLPDTLNAGQRILLVAPEITEGTASVISYLSEKYGVPINGISFDIFTLGGRRLLVRHVVRENSSDGGCGIKRRPPQSRDEFIALAHTNQVGEAFEHLLTLEDVLPAVTYFVQTVRLSADAPNGKSLAVLSLYPTAETAGHTLSVYLLPQNLVQLYGVPQPECETFVQQLQAVGKPLPDWNKWPGIALTTLDQSQEFVRRFREFIAGAPQMSGEDLPLV